MKCVFYWYSDRPLDVFVRRLNTFTDVYYHLRNCSDISLIDVCYSVYNDNEIEPCRHGVIKWDMPF